MNESVVYVIDEASDEHDGLRQLLTLSKWQVGFLTSGQKFLEQLDSRRCACLVTELHTDDLSAGEILFELAARQIAIPTIIVTRNINVRLVVEAMTRGAFDVLQKPLERNRLHERIEKALEVDRSRQIRMTERISIEARWATLTNNERSVVRLIMQGKSNREIAVQLECSRRAIENRRTNVMFKMKAASLAQLVYMICSSLDPSLLGDRS